ncbi:hypothetical protein EXIGLDRAFT_832598 [Exidia glandulosa HHB12029]|uniref:Alpha/beta hydrolase fold-3 domain-containing protein n=1 Tax=Exidia glandulosa HHB12029 TaxID=1314781 RepID=A0A165LHH1_EXIGL|nr:hypothetical protein EXIGLDRAFT_832598 [Exidia glandulosa HHB12029]
MADTSPFLRRPANEAGPSSISASGDARDGPWASLNTSSLWSLSTKVWTYTFGWFLQTAVYVLTLDHDVRYLFRKHCRTVWIDTPETGRCRLLLHYPRRRMTERSDASGVVVHFHGGGWAICRPEMEYELAQRMADELGVLVISPDYRKAPCSCTSPLSRGASRSTSIAQYPYPHALLQAHAVLMWIASGGLNGHPGNHHVDPTRIALTGSSAGGNLAASLTLLCIHRPLPNNAQIVGLGLNYPVLDAATPYVSKLSGIDAKIVLPPWFSRFILHAYLPPPRSVRDPYVSPFQAPREDLQRFPTTAIVTASQDYLSTEGDAFARTLKECGVRVAHRRFEEVGHAFDLMPTLDWARRRRNKKATEEAYDMFVQSFMDLLQ